MSNEPRFRPRMILGGVAEGSHSDHAVHAAADLAQSYEARLELVHVVPPHPTLGVSYGSADAAAMNAEAVARARDIVGAHLSHTQHGVQVGGTPVEDLLHVRPGHPAQVVLERAAEVEADLLVLGESGRKKQLDFGGVARGLLAKASCPIWIQTQRPQPIERVLAPVDLSEHSMQALAAALDLAAHMDARVTALNCFTVREYAYIGIPYGQVGDTTPSIESVRTVAREHFDAAMANVDWRGVEHDAVFAEEDPAHAVLARQGEHDLIVLGTHGRTGLAATLIGSVAYHVLRTAHTPVLAIRMDARPWLVS
jgi:nucleotide-binding universal stress UspA family protein